MFWNMNLSLPTEFLINKEARGLPITQASLTSFSLTPYFLSGTLSTAGLASGSI